MRKTIGWMRMTVLGALVGGSLGFGATQALASSAAVSNCDGYGEFHVGTCPSKDCSGLCADNGFPDGGLCLQGCCTCAY